MKIKICSIIVLVVILSIAGSNQVSAHTNIVVGDVTIEAGWEEEPPLIGEMNSIFLGFTKGDSPLIIDPRNLAIEVRYGGVSKEIDIEATEELGIYLSSIIPTRLGSYSISMQGVVDGNNVDAEIPIEDVEDKQRLAFPDTSAESSELRNLASQLQSSINQLQVTVDQVSGKISNAENSAEQARNIAQELRSDADRAYSFGMVGMGLGAAGLVVAVAAMTMRRKRTGEF